MRTTTTFVAILVSGLFALPALASGEPLAEPFKLRSDLFALTQDDLDVLDDEGGGAPAEKAPEREVTPGGQTLGETVGGATGFVRKIGFYTSSDLGGFLRFGGWADGEQCGVRCERVLYSNLQPWIALAVGYDILDFLGVQVSFGSGFVANAAPVQGSADSPRDYGITFVNLAVTGSWYIDRFGIVGKVFGGGSFVEPAPVPQAPFYGGNVGAGAGVRWATLLTDVTVGLDVNGHAVFVPDGAGMIVIPAMSFAPVIKYVF